MERKAEQVKAETITQSTQVTSLPATRASADPGSEDGFLIPMGRSNTSQRWNAQLLTTSQHQHRASRIHRVPWKRLVPHFAPWGVFECKDGYL